MRRLKRMRFVLMIILCLALVWPFYKPIVANADSLLPLIPVPPITFPIPSIDPEINIPDPVFKQWVEDRVSRYTTGTIRQSHIDKFCEEIFNPLPQQVSFFGRKIKSLEGLQYFAKCNITNIFISNQDIQDVTPLSVFTALEKLHISHTKLEDLRPLSSLVNLKNLELENNNIRSLEGLENLTNLTWLNISGNKIESLEPIRSLVRLEHFQAMSNKIANWEPVRNLSNLQTLRASNNPIQSLEPFSRLTRLTYLELSNIGLDNDEELKHLRNLNDITTLDLSKNSVTDITPLQFLTRVTGLFLQENRIIDLAPLSNMSRLHTLKISDNLIKDIGPLKNLTNLKRLIANNNWISDLRPIQHIDLERIEMRNNKIDGESVSNLPAMLRWAMIGTFIDLADQDVNKAYPLDDASSGSSGGDSSTEPETRGSEETPVPGEIVRGPHNFRDIAGHWAEADIQWAYERGMVNGVAEGIFQPNGLTTEEQFLKMLLIAMGALTEEPVSVPWSQKYYQFALEYGYPIHPAERSETMTRTQVAELIAATQGQRLRGNAAIQYLLDKGLSNGKTSATIEGYAGGDPLTRAEAVRFIRNVLSKAEYKVPQRLLGDS